jgi:class 3 adenylate cyclase
MSQIVEAQKTHWITANELFRSGLMPYIGTAVSMTICYLKFFSPVLAPFIGVDWDFNPHVQAVLMWLFALMAVYSVFLDRSKHQDRYPLYIATSGLVIIVGTLYIRYDPDIEVVGYFLLLAGAFLNQNSILKQLNYLTQLQAADLAEWNQTLGDRVAEQVAELDRIGQLKRFLSPKVADLIVAKRDKSLLESHRSYVAALFCDLRGFSSFSEGVEPEEVMDFLQQYHQVLGRVVQDYGGTIDHRAGDGLMAFFNDPLPCDEPVLQAVKLAFEAHDKISTLLKQSTKLGHQLGFGIGIAAGYATMGIVGDESRSDYTAIGNDINLASRLCDHAKDGETLISQRAYLEIEDSVEGHEVTGLDLKGVSRSQIAYRISNPG